MRTHDRRAFTMVELMVIMAVIGLLVAILTPALSGVHKVGRQTQCMNHLNNIGVAIRTIDAKSRVSGTAPLQVLEWRIQIMPFLSQSKDVMLCPEGSTEGLTAGSVDKQLAGYALRTYSGTTFLYDMMLKEGPACRKENIRDGGKTYDLSFEDQRTSDGSPTGDFSYNNPSITVKWSNNSVQIIVKGGGGAYHWYLIDPTAKVLMPDLLKVPESQAGASVTIGGTVWEKFSYGLNSVTDKIPEGADRIMGLDYPVDIARIAGYNETHDNWLKWVKPDGRYEWARHFNRCNVLMINGSVIRLSPREMDPADPLLVEKYWRKPGG